MKISSGKAAVVGVIIILLVAILLAVTNPKHEGHIQAIKDAYKQKDIVSSVVVTGILAVAPPAYHNLTLLSYTRHKNKLASIGILGYVWVNDQVYKNQ